jgi:hypothetical protein
MGSTALPETGRGSGAAKLNVLTGTSAALAAASFVKKSLRLSIAFLPA